jgi:hypothetical protein
MLRIQSLNSAMLLRNGLRVRLNAGLSLTLEVLCYFIVHDSCSIESVLNDVFTDVEPRLARNYFHLIRCEIRDRTKLRVVFNQINKQYRLEGFEALEWDVQLLRNQMRAGTVQPEDFAVFLPESSSAWVLLERHKLETEFVLASFNILHSLEAAGRGEEWMMLERLLACFPLNGLVLGFDVRYTARKVSREAAREHLEVFKQRFEMMGLPVPETLGTCMSLH